LKKELAMTETIKKYIKPFSARGKAFFIAQFQRKLKTLQKNGSPYENGLALIYS
jgi:hypothetical protein